MRSAGFSAADGKMSKPHNSSGSLRVASTLSTIVCTVVSTVCGFASAVSTVAPRLSFTRTSGIYQAAAPKALPSPSEELRSVDELN